MLGTALSVLHLLTHLILTSIPSGICCYYHHFADEEIRHVLLAELWQRQIWEPKFSTEEEQAYSTQLVSKMHFHSCYMLKKKTTPNPNFRCTQCQVLISLNIVSYICFQDNKQSGKVQHPIIYVRNLENPPPLPEPKCPSSVNRGGSWYNFILAA